MSGNIRIPPESTGPRIGANKKYILEYDTLVSMYTDGDIITGATSLAYGEIAGHKTEGYPTNSGRLYLKNVTGTFVDNELLKVGATTIATSDFTNETFAEWSYQETVTVDGDNPSIHQKLDAFGSSLVTFKDGAPSVGAFGALNVGTPQVIKHYRFAYGENASLFYDQETSGATVGYDSNKGVCLLTNPTTSGAVAQRTSHYYHPYQPGVGQRIEMTLQLGDTGKTNVTRRWGYYDDNNGAFWELNGTSLRICMRSNVSGSVVDTYTESSAFNVDKLDGVDDSLIALDVSLANIYWMDLQWLGAGRVRYGILLSDGSSQVAHSMKHANITNLPYMRTATLPLRVEQINTGTSSGTSELNWGCGDVKHSSRVEYTGPRFSYDVPSPVNVQPTDTNLPILSIRPKTTLNSIPNHSIFRLSALNLANLGTNSANPLVFTVWVTNSTNLTDAAFSSVGAGSGFEVDYSASAITTPALAIKYATWIVSEGQSQFIQTQQSTTEHDAELYLDADGTTQKAFVLTADNLGAANTSAWASSNWNELQH